MKSKIKRHSRSVLSVILSVCMLVSCMTVGLIATDAAKVTGKVGATDDDFVGDYSFKSGDGIHLQIGSGSNDWHEMGTATDNEYEFTLASAATIKYSFSVNSQYYCNDSSLGTPSESSKSGYNWYAKQNGGSGVFSISLSAGTYKFKLKSLGSDLQYGFWKTSGGTSTTTVTIFGHVTSSTANQWDATGKTMSRDSVSGYYYYTHTVPNAADYFRIKINNNGTETEYGPSSDTQVELSGDKVTLTVKSGEKSYWLRNDQTPADGIAVGTEVVIWCDAEGKKVWVVPSKCTVTAATYTDGADTYGTVTVNDGASATVDPDDMVTLVASVAEGFESKYRFTGWDTNKYLEYSDSTSTTTTAIVTGTTTVKAMISKRMYAVTCSTAEHGSVSTNVEKYAWGTEVAVKVNPDSGFRLSALTYTPDGGDATDILEAKSFTMSFLVITRLYSLDMRANTARWSFRIPSIQSL